MDLLYVAMEYADENLAEIIPQRSLTLEESREALNAIVDVLVFLHGKGLTHGHICPANILAVGEFLKVSSDTIEPAADKREMTRERGSYDAPEIPGSRYTQSADVWSLGVTLVEMLTQQPAILPFNESVEAVIPSVVREPFGGCQACLAPQAGSSLDQCAGGREVEPEHDCGTGGCGKCGRAGDGCLSRGHADDPGFRDSPGATSRIRGPCGFDRPAGTARGARFSAGRTAERSALARAGRATCEGIAAGRSAATSHRIFSEARRAPDLRAAQLCLAGVFNCRGSGGSNRAAEDTKESHRGSIECQPRSGARVEQAGKRRGQTACTSD
jgi:hypothetical protein